MFIHSNEGGETLPSTWQTQSRPGHPGHEVNHDDEKTLCQNSTASEKIDECMGGVCSLNWKPQAHSREVA